MNAKDFGFEIRPLEASEVEFLTTYEEDDLDPRGNVMASGDDAADAAAEREVIRRLQSGDASAWCTVRVRARWKGYEGRSILGAVTLTDEYTLETCAREHGMQDEALGDLNDRIAKAWEQLWELRRVTPVRESGSS